MRDMSPSLVLVAVVVVLVAVGVYLLLERTLTRVLLGVIVLGNGINVLFLVAGGAAGGPPIVGRTEVEDMADPLPQAMALTAIVITLGMSAFLLALAYRSWQLNEHDEVQDDLEDRRVARRAAQDRAAYEDADAESGAGLTALEEAAAETYDETDADDDGRIDDHPGSRGEAESAAGPGTPATGRGER